jgi:hypothetical protein
MNRPPKSSPRKTNQANKETTAKGVELTGKIKAQQIDKSGLTSRVQGHMSARVKRSQGQRDAK